MRLGHFCLGSFRFFGSLKVDISGGRWQVISLISYWYCWWLKSGNHHLELGGFRGGWNWDVWTIRWGLWGHTYLMWFVAGSWVTNNEPEGSGPYPNSCYSTRHWVQESKGLSEETTELFADAFKSSSFIAIAVCRSKGIIHSMTLSELKVGIRSGSYQAWLPNHIHTVPKTNILR